MASVVVTLKIMPESPDIDLEKLNTVAQKSILQFCGETQTRTAIEPIAFGLNALKITFVMDESKGSTEPLENSIQGLEGVNSIEIVDIRRTIG